MTLFSTKTTWTFEDMGKMFLYYSIVFGIQEVAKDPENKCLSTGVNGSCSLWSGCENPSRHLGISWWGQAIRSLPLSSSGDALCPFDGFFLTQGFRVIY